MFWYWFSFSSNISSVLFNSLSAHAHLDTHAHTHHQRCNIQFPIFWQLGCFISPSCPYLSSLVLPSPCPPLLLTLTTALSPRPNLEPVHLRHSCFCSQPPKEVLNNESSYGLQRLGASVWVPDWLSWPVPATDSWFCDSNSGLVFAPQKRASTTHQVCIGLSRRPVLLA